ncbi:MAG TPA: response regulator [Gemmatimonadales bacterium]|nr:response regulator [Gemmatimonadales bacterium]
MSETRGRILLADDDPSYSATMAELLRAEGYDVTCVGEGDAAFKAAEQEQFDLLLADLEMPGNEDLALVKGVAGRHGNLPIIIVTGFPSLRTAMASIELPVTAYLVKPVTFPNLANRIEQAVTRYRAFRRADERMEQMRQELAQAATTVGGTGKDAFMRLALRNVLGSLTDVEQLATSDAPGGGTVAHTCQQLNCPRGAQLTEAVRETIYVLEETRSSFKSTQLRDLRRKLNLLLEHL